MSENPDKIDKTRIPRKQFKRKRVALYVPIQVGSGLDVGTMLRRMRHRMQIEVKELARVTGIGEQRIFRIEAGEIKKPSFEAIEKLFAAMGVRIAFTIAVAGIEDNRFDELLVRGESTARAFYREHIFSRGGEEWRMDKVLKFMGKTEQAEREQQQPDVTKTEDKIDSAWGGGGDW